jgi:hypothetical protein
MALVVSKYDPAVTWNLIAGEAILEGQLCGIADTNGKAVLADGNGTQGTGVADKALGYAVKGAAIGKMVALAPICTIDGFTSLTVAGECYLSTTAGGVTQTKTSTNGETLQVVGQAISATKIAGNVHVPQKYQTAGNSTLTSY